MSFFEELKRRNVFRVGIAYAITGWVLLQVADLVLDNVEAPSWVMHVFMLAVAIGFVAAVIIAWAYEVTPEGIKRESEIDPAQSVTHHTAKKLDVITLGAIGLLVVLLLVDRFVLEGNDGSESLSQEPEVSATQAGQEKTAVAPGDSSAATDIPGKSIAVLPLANRSVNPEDAFFAEGIHDEILTRLSRVSALKVISRTSVMSYANTTKKMAEIGNELGVATLLEGGVQRAGDRVRINVQLIEAATDKHLWAEVYDRELTADNLFDIQSEITRSISDALQAVLSGDEREALDNKPTDNVEAYAYFLRAKALAAGYGRSVEVIRESIRIYEAALELDPEFAAAWAAMSTDWIELYWSTTGLGGERDQSEAALAKARELAPEAAETLIAEGYLRYWGYLDYERALTAFRSALQKKPGSVLALRGQAYVLRRMGELEQSIATFRQAIELDPNDPGMPADLGYTLLHRGNIDEAELMFRRAIAQDPDNLWNRWAFTNYFLMLNQPRQALELFGDIPEGASEGHMWGLHFAARILEDEQTMARVIEVWRTQELIEGASLVAHALWLQQEGQLDSIREPLLQVEGRLLDAAERSPDPDTILSSLNIIYGLIGDRDRLEANIDRFRRELRPDAMRIVEDISRPYGWALVGAHDRVLDYAEEMVNAFGIWEFSVFVQDPIFDGLRGNPRYKLLALQYDRWLESVK